MQTTPHNAGAVVTGTSADQRLRMHCPTLRCAAEGGSITRTGTGEPGRKTSCSRGSSALAPPLPLPAVGGCCGCGCCCMSATTCFRGWTCAGASARRWASTHGRACQQRHPCDCRCQAHVLCCLCRMSLPTRTSLDRTICARSGPAARQARPLACSVMHDHTKQRALPPLTACLAAGQHACRHARTHPRVQVHTTIPLTPHFQVVLKHAVPMAAPSCPPG